MALKFSDGTTKTNVTTQIYPLAGGTVVYTAAKGAFGVAGLDLPSNITLNQTLGAQYVTIFHNFWFATPLIGATAITIWQAFDTVGASIQLQLQISTAGTLQLFRGATLIATYATTPFVINTQYHFEIKTTIDASSGVCQVRLNGNTTPVISFSGNTRNSANTFTDQTRWGPAGNTTNYHNYYSHISIFDATGAAPNDWIGVKRIYTQMPTADSATGGLNDFATTPSQSAGSNHLNVDEQPPDDDTSYNSDSVTSDRESYKVAGVSSSITNITVVNAFVRMRIDDAGPHTVNIVARNGTTDTTGSAQSVGASYLYYNEPFPLDPNTTAAWTASGFGTSADSNAEFGINIAS
jgi:hypothetical protein